MASGPAGAAAFGGALWWVDMVFDDRSRLARRRHRAAFVGIPAPVITESGNFIIVTGVSIADAGDRDQDHARSRG
jgi:hypothetical protein